MGFVMKQVKALWNIAGFTHGLSMPIKTHIFTYANLTKV